MKEKVKVDNWRKNFDFPASVEHRSSAMVGHLHNFDWSILSTLLTSSSPIPGDIKFKVVDKEDGLVTTLEAHKIILALHSDHFKNAFFGSGVKFKEEEEGIMVIKETTRAAFEDFVGFYYEKDIELEKKSLRELYEILNLAERYQVAELKERVSDHIKSFPLSIDNVVEVAAAATQDFSHFEKTSEALYASCVAIVETKLTDLQSVVNFIQRNGEEATVMKLLKELKNPCSNCQQRPCLKGSTISANDLIVPGVKVENNFVGGWAPSKAMVVVSRSGGIVTLRLKSETNSVSDLYQSNIVDRYGVPVLQYACDK